MIAVLLNLPTLEKIAYFQDKNNPEHFRRWVCDALVKENKGFVCSRVKIFIRRGKSFDDLVCAGNFGLVKALEKYDSTKGALTTYAASWIDKYLRLALKEENPYQISYTQRQKQKLVSDAATELGTYDSLRIAEYVGLEESEVYKLQQFALPTTLPTLGVETEELKLADAIDTEVEVHLLEAKAAIAEFLESLEDIERQVFTLRLIEQLSFEKIASVVKSSRETVRRLFYSIKAKACEALAIVKHLFIDEEPEPAEVNAEPTSGIGAVECSAEKKQADQPQVRPFRLAQDIVDQLKFQLNKRIRLLENSLKAINMVVIKRKYTFSDENHFFGKSPVMAGKLRNAETHAPKRFFEARYGSAKEGDSHQACRRSGLGIWSNTC